MKKFFRWLKDNVFWLVVGGVLFIVYSVGKLLLGGRKRGQYPYSDPPRNFDDEVKKLEKKARKRKEERDAAREKDHCSNPFGCGSDCNCSRSDGPGD